MDFSNLTPEGYASFVLALIFSIVSIAGFIYYAKHREAGRLSLILITLVFPALTILFWMYLILNVWAYPIPVALGVAFGTSIAYVAVALAIGFGVMAIIDARKNKPTEEKTEEPTVEEPVEETTETEEESKETKLLNAPEEIKEDVVEAVVETAENKEENAEPVEQGVVFSNEPKKTFDEQLNALDEEKRNCFNEIFEYAMEKPNTKCSKAKYHRTVKIGAMKLLDAKFSKEALLCNFMAGSSELKNYSKKEKTVKIKEKPVIIEIENADSVAVAKNMIDIVYKNIADAKEERAEEKKAKRRKPKKEEAQVEVVETAEPVETTETKVEEKTEEVVEKPRKRGRPRKNTNNTENE